MQIGPEFSLLNHLLKLVIRQSYFDWCIFESLFFFSGRPASVSEHNYFWFEHVHLQIPYITILCYDDIIMILHSMPEGSSSYGRVLINIIPTATPPPIKFYRSFIKAVNNSGLKAPLLYPHSHVKWFCQSILTPNRGWNISI